MAQNFSGGAGRTGGGGTGVQKDYTANYSAGGLVGGAGREGGGGTGVQKNYTSNYSAGNLVGGAGREGGGGTGVQKNYTANYSAGGNAGGGNVSSGLLGGSAMPNILPASSGTPIRSPIVFDPQFRMAALSAGLQNIANRYNTGAIGFNQALNMLAPYQGAYGFSGTTPTDVSNFLSQNTGAQKVGEFSVSLESLKKAVDSGQITDPEVVRQVNENYNPFTGMFPVSANAYQKDLLPLATKGLPTQADIDSAYARAALSSPSVPQQSQPAMQSGGFITDTFTNGMLGIAPSASKTYTDRIPETESLGYGPSVIDGNTVYKSAPPSLLGPAPVYNYSPSDTYRPPAVQQSVPYDFDITSDTVLDVATGQRFPVGSVPSKQFTDRLISDEVPQQSVAGYSPSGTYRPPATNLPIYSMDNVPVVDQASVDATGPVNLVPENYYTNSENVPDYQPGLLEVLGQKPVNDLSPRADWQVIESQPTPYSPAPEDAGVFEKFANEFKPGNLFPYAKDVNPIEGTPEGQYIQQTEFGPLKGFMSVPYRYEPMDKPVYGAPGVPDGWTAPVKGASVITFKDGGGIWKHPSQGWQPISQFRGDLGDTYKGEGGKQAQKEAVAAAKLNSDETATTSSTEGTDSSMLPQWYLDWLQSTGQYGGLLG